MEPPRLTLTMSLLSENQYQKYLTAYKKFITEITTELITDEKEHPNAIKPYLMLYSILPITEILGNTEKNQKMD